MKRVLKRREERNILLFFPPPSSFHSFKSSQKARLCDSYNSNRPSLGEIGKRTLPLLLLLFSPLSFEFDYYACISSEMHFVDSDFYFFPPQRERRGARRKLCKNADDAICKYNRFGGCACTVSRCLFNEADMNFEWSHYRIVWHPATVKNS